MNFPTEIMNDTILIFSFLTYKCCYYIYNSSSTCYRLQLSAHGRDWETQDLMHESHTQTHSVLDQVDGRIWTEWLGREWSNGLTLAYMLRTCKANCGFGDMKSPVDMSFGLR